MFNDFAEVLDEYYQDRMIKDRIEGRLVVLLNQSDHLRKYDRGRTVNMAPFEAAETWLNRDRDAERARRLIVECIALIDEALVYFPNAQPLDHGNDPRIDITQRFFLDYLEMGLFYLSLPLEGGNDWIANHLERSRDAWYGVETKWLEGLKKYGREH